jgi:NAD(P)-dependent dehydrogenase (short-subunit alcohol dehydrogenase family)
MGAYNISKYGVVALSETMSRELQIAGASVGVSVLCPAFVRTGIAESDRNMPAELRARMQTDPLEGAESIIKGLVAAGMSPDAVADEVHDAVVANRFWILTHPETFEHVTARANEIVSGANPTPGLIG